MGYTVGDVLAERTVHLTRESLVRYAGASGDFNPIHYRDDVAASVGLPGVLAHGMLTMGMTGRMLTDFVGDGRLTYYGVRFVSQVWPGDTLTATATVTGVRTDDDGTALADIEIVTVNQDERPVLTGTATARLDA
ncbi:MaoC/PaaZ C-terminal domain-containing protein [Microbacterium maritypicum]|uniref:MaoC/PaaZ C-terminal domain-containing protein n=1 Tax=Microbacterium maritypicum TaxID=33918 RepID=UPI00296ECD86|nr:MaoC/PaaZ C-terminal domain-containing protein [Microbacterium liquefaciens]